MDNIKIEPALGSVDCACHRGKGIPPDSVDIEQLFQNCEEIIKRIEKNTEGLSWQQRQMNFKLARRKSLLKKVSRSHQRYKRLHKQIVGHQDEISILQAALKRDQEEIEQLRCGLRRRMYFLNIRYQRFTHGHPHLL